MKWNDMCRSEQLRGRWVVLDNVRYSPGTTKPAEGDVVDADYDLADLCTRMRASARTSCAVVFCNEEPLERPAGLGQRLRRAVIR